MDDKSKTANKISPSEEWPTWMRQSRQNVDWGILIAIFFGLLAAWPFLLQEGLPRTNATENHVFMAADYAEAFREGRLYPRWSAAALSGYGAPIPNYYPPGAAYSAATLELLFTDDTVIAVRLLYVLSSVMASAMTYVFVMRWAGAAEGILASVLYVYSPYIGMTAPHILGDLPGIMSMALLPTLLWAMHRLLLRNYVFDFMLVSLISSALLLTDVKMTFAGAFFSITLIGWYAYTQEHKINGFRVFFAWLVGILLASFFWIPALFEQDAIRWMESSFEPITHKLNFHTLITPLHKVDLSELVPQPQLAIGSGILIFAVLGIINVLKERENREMYLFFAVSGFFILLSGSTLLTEEIWLLGPLTLCLSITGSATIRLRRHLPHRYRRLALPTILVSVITMAITVWLPPQWPASFGDSGPSGQILYEQQGYGIAVLPPGQDIPVTIPSPIVPNRSLISNYQTDTITRIPQNQLPVASDEWESETHEDRYSVFAEDAITFEVLRANFPGWKATLDDIPLELQTSETNGLIQLTIPPTYDGELVIVLGATPLRQTAWIISWSMFVFLLLGTLVRSRRQRNITYDNQELISVEETRLLTLILIGFFLCILMFATENSPYTLHSRPGHLLDGSIELSTRTTTGLEALSYRLDKRNYQAGQSIDFFIAWRTSRKMLQNYSVRVYLQEANQEIYWAQSQAHYPGSYPTRRWTTNRYVRDSHNISLDSEMIPGTYQIAVEVYNCDPECSPDNRLDFFDQNGQLIGQTFLLPTLITVAP
jgi:hypothetical protein